MFKEIVEVSCSSCSATVSVSARDFFARKVHDKGREEAAGLKVGAKKTRVFWIY